MKKVILAGIVAILATQPAFAQSDSDKVVAAIVKGEKIYRSDIEELKEEHPKLKYVPVEAVYNEILSHVVNNRILLEEAKKENIDESEEVEEALKRTKKDLIRSVYLEKQIEKHLTEEKLRETYKTFLENSPSEEQVHVQHILVEEKKAAEDLIEQLEDGADFAKLAREHSIGPSSEKGGDLGFVSEDAVVEPFAKAAFSMAPGKVTEDPVKTQFGWHVIRVKDKRVKTPPKFEEVKPQLEAKLSEQIANKVLADLKDSYEVKLFTFEGKPMTEEN